VQPAKTRSETHRRIRMPHLPRADAFRFTASVTRFRRAVENLAEEGAKQEASPVPLRRSGCSAATSGRNRARPPGPARRSPANLDGLADGLLENGHRLVDLDVLDDEGRGQPHHALPGGVDEHAELPAAPDGGGCRDRELDAPEQAESPYLDHLLRPQPARHLVKTRLEVAPGHPRALEDAAFQQ